MVKLFIFLKKNSLFQSSEVCEKNNFMSENPELSWRIGRITAEIVELQKNRRQALLLQGIEIMGCADKQDQNADIQKWFVFFWGGAEINFSFYVHL